jgi:hypothetical protein
VSLSTDPTFSVLKDQFVCGVRDISKEKFAGASGKHKPGETAVYTTNGAGPHNIQLFILAADGTVLHCLPGYWTSEDLARELSFAAQLNTVYTNPAITLEQKKNIVRHMQIAHISQHSDEMTKRSRMQGFDEAYELKRGPGADTLIDPRLAKYPQHGKLPLGQVKTTDVVMHERMALRPLIAYEDFDVARFSNYGKPDYDKQEMFRDSKGNIAAGANTSNEPMIGNTPKAHPIKTQAKSLAKNGLGTALRYGLQAVR